MLPMPIRGVLFDVGGPLDTEVTRERLIDEHLRAAFAAAGHAVNDAVFAEAVRWAVDAFAPDAYQAIIWRLAGQDVVLSEHVYRTFAARAHERQVFELREGIPELLDHLHTRGLHLGLAANQQHSIIAQLDAHDIGHYFHHREVFGTHGLRKPDVRLFLRACDDLGISPVDCIMVGDRIDNDVVPAKLLGMRTVLFRTGRHRATAALVGREAGCRGARCCRARTCYSPLDGELIRVVTASDASNRERRRYGRRGK
jgi:putative hydrolase of the HAD superfamily